jgi:hypothetical protein
MRLILDRAWCGPDGCCSSIWKAEGENDGKESQEEIKTVESRLMKGLRKDKEVRWEMVGVGRGWRDERDD